MYWSCRFCSNLMLLLQYGFFYWIGLFQVFVTGDYLVVFFKFHGRWDILLLLLLPTLINLGTKSRYEIRGNEWKDLWGRLWSVSIADSLQFRSSFKIKFLSCFSQKQAGVPDFLADFQSLLNYSATLIFLKITGINFNEV